MNDTVLKLYNTLSKLCRLEVTFKLGANREMSKDAVEFIKHYQGSGKLTGIFDETYLQIIAWDGKVPISIFRESVLTYTVPPPQTIYSFFISTLRYYHYKHKTCKHANSKS